MEGAGPTRRQDVHLWCRRLAEAPPAAACAFLCQLTDGATAFQAYMRDAERLAGNGVAIRGTEKCATVTVYSQTFLKGTAAAGEEGER